MSMINDNCRFHDWNRVFKVPCAVSWNRMRQGHPQFRRHHRRFLPNNFSFADWVQFHILTKRTWHIPSCSINLKLRNQVLAINFGLNASSLTVVYSSHSLGTLGMDNVKADHALVQLRRLLWSIRFFSLNLGLFVPTVKLALGTDRAYGQLWMQATSLKNKIKLEEAVHL